MPIVVTDHTFTPTEEGGEYELIIATQTIVEHAPTPPLYGPDPAWEPTEDDLSAPIIEIPQVTPGPDVVLSDPESFKWSGADPRWDGKDSATIAAEQFQIVKDILDARAQAAEHAVTEQAAPEKLPGTVGQRL